MNEKSLEKIQTQIKEMYRKAFYDSINESINSENPDYDWITNLYIEIKDRLLRLVRKESKTYKEIENSFDEKLFDQMIRNDVFDTTSMVKLVENTFYWIEKLQAPARDEYSKQAKIKIFNSEPKLVVVTFLKEVHFCLDNIEDDIKSFYENLKK